jgi:hypothetical protein
VDHTEVTASLGQQVGDVEALVAEAQQFVWGGPEAAGVPALTSRLQEALAWGAALDAATQAKPTLQALDPLLAWQPPPIAHPGARQHTHRLSCHQK